MIYVVLGMHKSGTSLVAEILHRSGINMIEDEKQGLSYDEGEYYERKTTEAINREILSSGGKLSIYIDPLNEFEVSPEQSRQIKRNIQTCDQLYEDWGFKDPRTCLVYPIWERHLPEHRLIVVYRPLEELWPRYRSVYPTRSVYNAYRLVKSWHEHNSLIISYLRNTKMDYIVLSYPRLMTSQEEFDRLQGFIGWRLQDPRDMGLYRSKPRRIPLLVWAAWYCRQRYGYQAEETIEILDSFRTMK